MNSEWFRENQSYVESQSRIECYRNIRRAVEQPGPLPNATLKSGSLLALPFADRSFDGILAQNVLHHVTGRTWAENYANLEQAFREIHRCAATLWHRALERNGQVGDSHQ